MLTESLDIINIQGGNLEQYCFQSTGLFYKLYNNIELIGNREFIDQCLGEFPLLDKSMFDFCLAEAKTKSKQHMTQVNKNTKQIDKIAKELKKKKFKTKKELRKKYNLENKLASLKRNLNKNICFGGKDNLRKITEYKQKLQSKNDNINADEIKILLAKFEKQFKQNRMLGTYLVGRACEGGNRKIDFDLTNGKIYFKPKKGEKIEITFKQDKSNQELLSKLSVLVEKDLIPLTVRITPTQVHITYDNEFVNGYAFNKTEYLKQKNLLSTEEEKKECYKQFKTEQQERQLQNKKRNRFFAFDSNPEEIGFVIADRLSDSPDGDFKIVYKDAISFEELNIDLKKASSDVESIYQNNKRKAELKNAWSKIFGICAYYKVAYFCKEDLNIKISGKDEKYAEFNKKVNNLWHRTETEKSINKFCQNLGIIQIGLDPKYSSFIGNMCYPDYDSIASAIELVRRGITKFIKGRSIYPPMSRINQEKLVYLLGENVDLECETFVSLYKGRLAKLRYRNKESNFFLQGNYLCSYKSKVRRRVILVKA